VITAALLFLGSVLVIDNQITIGQFVAAEIVVLLIMNSAEKLILGMENIYDVLTALDKIGYVTDLPLENDEGIPFEEVSSGGGVSVELDKVTFKFSDSEVPTLKNVTMKIDAGERVCVAGYNGSGKSTFIQMLEGLYAEYEGMITYNGVPLKTIQLESLRQEIGSLNTRDEIFNGTILENIHLGNKDVPLKRIITVAKEIGLHSYINRLPNGYQTELLAGGINVPGSMRTKIMLTRIFILQPDLLVLENFLPRIEQMEKEHLIDFLCDRSKDWTMVAVSNNPAFAERCDRVIVLKDGEVIREGKFSDLKKDKYVREVFKLKAA
jgi:ABC-type bacteriocin/lantibiotic exporter with double-glycine peptidase domain